MEIGTYEMERETVDIEDVIREILRDYKRDIFRNEIDVSIVKNDSTNGEDSRYMAVGEHLLCYSLFSNLIKNALEATSNSGKIGITLSRDTRKQVSVSVWNERELPERIRENFGKKYFSSGKKSGTGLGLYSANLMTKTQGGSLWWTSLREEGTTLRVTLTS